MLQRVEGITAHTSLSTPSLLPRIVNDPSCTAIANNGQADQIIADRDTLTCAMSGTRGSSGFGSVSIEQIESKTEFGQPSTLRSIDQVMRT